LIAALEVLPTGTLKRQFLFHRGVATALIFERSKRGRQIRLELPEQRVPRADDRHIRSKVLVAGLQRRHDQPIAAARFCDGVLDNQMPTSFSQDAEAPLVRERVAGDAVMVRRNDQKSDSPFGEGAGSAREHRSLRALSVA
jgi:hypothetical protein